MVDTAAMKMQQETHYSRPCTRDNKETREFLLLLSQEGMGEISAEVNET